MAERRDGSARRTESVYTGVQQELLDGLFEQARVGLALHDTELRYIRVNAALAGINGVPAEAHVGRTPREVVPSLAASLVKRLHRVLVTGEPIIDLRISGRTPASPEQRHWLASFHPVERAGKPLGVVTVVLEVTERVEAERALAARERQQAAIAELGLEALASQDLFAFMHDAAESVAEFLGVEFARVLQSLSAAELMVMAEVGFGPHAQLGERVGPRAASQAAYTLRRGRAVVVDDIASERRFRPSPIFRQLGVVSSATVVIQGPGGPLGVLGAYTRNHRRFTADDVNFLQAAANVLGSALARAEAEQERRRLAEQAAGADVLRRSDELKTAVLRAVSHDLRSPLAAILAGAEALAAAEVDGDARGELSAAVVQQAAQLSRMVDKLLDLSRLSGDAAEPQAEWCLLDEIVDAALMQVPDAEQLVSVSLADLPPVRVDPIQIQAAFANLVENACRYSDGKPVEVAGRVEDDCVIVEVRDRGPGVPAAERGRIFEPFFRGEGRRNGNHSGLGLAIVKGFVEANGGTVRLVERDGPGSVFSVQLPADPGVSP